jgi:hypothetical protein
VYRSIATEMATDGVQISHVGVKKALATRQASFEETR